MTPEKLREIYGEVAPLAASKTISTLDQHCRRFIEHSTFLVLATSDATNLDVSPKGDPTGLVVVESDRTLLLPDRPGNNRIDGLLNILAHPNVALIFMIPTVNETLRVNGTAEITDERILCDQFQVNGRSPKKVLRITVDEIFTHCGRALMRAGLWKTETWPQNRPIPTLPEILQDHAHMDAGTKTEEASIEGKQSISFHGDKY
ncbi:pyridoxamine 5'-phosphate oxidase family protein [Roseibium sp.]|uniref:pyridoxamine 5'-phosphate oxidase family protein n=1 Tax=Roseibium sp. TaxID=1936156 RepID=UPI003B508C2D